MNLLLHHGCPLGCPVGGFLLTNGQYFCLDRDRLPSDLGVNFKIVQNRPTFKAVCTKISKKIFAYLSTFSYFWEKVKRYHFSYFEYLSENSPKLNRTITDYGSILDSQFPTVKSALLSFIYIFKYFWTHSNIFEHIQISLNTFKYSWTHSNFLNTFKYFWTHSSTYFWTHSINFENIQYLLYTWHIFFYGQKWKFRKTK